MKKFQESVQDILPINRSPEPVSQPISSEYLAHSDLLLNQRQRLYHVLQEKSDVLESSIVDLTSGPYHHGKNIDNQVQEVLQNDIIASSVTPWASLVVLVRKADQTLQLCTDYQKINKATLKDSYLLPHIKNTLDTLYGNILVMTLDLLKVYHQIKVKENSRKKIAFTTKVTLHHTSRVTLSSLSDHP